MAVLSFGCNRFVAHINPSYARFSVKTFLRVCQTVQTKLALIYLFPLRASVLLEVLYYRVRVRI